MARRQVSVALQQAIRGKCSIILPILFLPSPAPTEEEVLTLSLPLQHLRLRRCFVEGVEAILTTACSYLHLSMPIYLHICISLSLSLCLQV